MSFEVPGKSVWGNGKKTLTSEGYMVTIWDRGGPDKVRITKLFPRGNRKANLKATRLFVEMMRLKPDADLVSNPNPKFKGCWVSWVDPGTGRFPDRPDRVAPHQILGNAPEGRWIPEGTTDDMVWMTIPWYRAGTVRVKMVDTPPEWWCQWLEARNAYYQFVGKPKEFIHPDTI